MKPVVVNPSINFEKLIIITELIATSLWPALRSASVSPQASPMSNAAGL